MLADDELDTVHAHLARTAVALLRAKKSTFRNKISSHIIESPLTFSNLEKYCIAATEKKRVNASALFIGSIDGELVISARLGPVSAPAPVPSGKKKRARESDAGDRAEAACAKLLERDDVDKERVEVARGALERLLRDVKGPKNEEVFEAIGLRAATNAQTSSRVPSLMINARISAGLPLSIKSLRASLGARCFLDGLLTSNPDGLSSEYQLPNLLPDGGIAEVTKECGQRSIFLFSAVS